jgi:hypothetical protein
METRNKPYKLLTATSVVSCEAPTNLLNLESPLRIEGIKALQSRARVLGISPSSKDDISQLISLTASSAV